MVALYRCRFASSRFDDIGVDSSLRKEFYIRELSRFLFKDPHEFGTDDLTLLLGIGHAAERRKESLLRVNADKMKVSAAERRLDLIALVLSHKSVIDEDAVELSRDCL